MIDQLEWGADGNPVWREGQPRIVARALRRKGVVEEERKKRARKVLLKLKAYKKTMKLL